MVVGTTLFKLSPQFSRGGLAATFAIDVTHVSNIHQFMVSIESRNSEDTTWTTIGAFANITATGAYQV